MRTPIHDLHVAFQSPCLHDFNAKLRRQHSEVNQIQQKGNVRNIKHKIFKGLKFSGGQSYDTICLTNFVLIEALHILYARISASQWIIFHLISSLLMRSFKHACLDEHQVWKKQSSVHVSGCLQGRLCLQQPN